MIQTIAISNYRSLRNLIFPLEQLNVITGANGSGKSSVYRALRLLAEVAQGSLIPSLAREGGLQSTLWAGPESFSRSVKEGYHPVQGTVRQDVVNLRLGFAGSELGYLIDLGLPKPGRTAFSLDPEIKHECVWSGPVLRRSGLLVDRRGAMVRVLDEQGVWQVIENHIATFDSAMTQLADPRHTPELLLLRKQMESWRFYDSLRTDAAAPARMSQVGTHTPVLSHDGADFAAAIQTIREIGNADAMDAAVEDAFPGAAIEVVNEDGYFTVMMQQRGLLRPLKAAELSDGTLRYLLWIAALLTPRPPELLVLNEPETSLHPDLLPALGRLIRQAAEHSQVVVVSHSQVLIEILEQESSCNALHLEKALGETKIQGQGILETPQWQWPSR